MSTATSPLAATPEDKVQLAARLSTSTDNVLHVLGILLALSMAIFVLWGMFVPIASGVTAPGRIGVETRRKTIQHLDGGVVRAILVREGVHVKAGDILVRLDDTEAKLAVSVLQGQVDALRAEQAARQAELAGTSKVTFPADLLARANDPNVAAVLHAQQNAFAARRSNVGGRKAQLGERLDQLNRQIAGSDAQSKAHSEQIDLLDSEIDDVQNLYAKGLTTRTRLLALQRAAAQSRGERGALDSDVARLKAQETEVSIARMQVERESDTDATDVLRQVQAQLVEAIDKLSAAKAHLERTQVRAPVSGLIVGMQVTTIGGVIRPGETMMEIIPVADRLVVNAKVDPRDADAIHLGQSVSVRLDGAGTRFAPVLAGRVEKISGDALTDQRTGLSYFELEVGVTDGALKDLPRHLMRPGLPADVLVETGSRSAFGYMFSPLAKASFYAMRER